MASEGIEIRTCPKTTRTLTLTTWDESRQQSLTPFTDGDFASWGMSPTAPKGVHVKEFLTDASGRAWVAKSGALAQQYPADHNEAMERGRRVAFPVNEAITALLYSQAGILMNNVGLGFRRMLNPLFGIPELLMTSFHEMQHGTLRSEMGVFKRSARYIEDLFCMACLDVIMGHRDHKPHNYIVTPAGQLLPFDNSDCMYEDWLEAPCKVSVFHRARTDEPECPSWTDDSRAAVATRMAAVTPEVIDLVFAAVPEEFVREHDESVDAGPYAAGSMLEKRDRMKTNLKVFKCWASSVTAT